MNTKFILKGLKALFLSVALNGCSTTVTPTGPYSEHVSANLGGIGVSFTRYDEKKQKMTMAERALAAGDRLGALLIYRSINGVNEEQINEIVEATVPNSEEVNYQIRNMGKNGNGDLVIQLGQAPSPSPSPSPSSPQPQP